MCSNPSLSKFFASHTKPGPNMALAVARKSSFSDSTDEQVSMMSFSNFVGICVGAGDCNMSQRLYRGVESH